MLQKLRDPVSCLTHLAGAVLAIPCTVLLLVQSARHASAWHITAFAIFGASLFLLYTASAVYHMLRVSENTIQVLRRIDHIMIFILIAGTYTPVCLLPLRGAWGWTLFGLVWGIAALGIVLKIVWMHAPEWLSTSLYVAMGWLVVIAFYPLIQVVSTGALWLLVSGGLAYTVGAVVFAVEWPPLRYRWFGCHELFHLFVLMGSALHAMFMFQLIPA